MEDTASRLRSASDALLRDLETLAVLEEEKRSLQPDDDRITVLATEIRDLAARVLGETQEQEVLAKVINDEAASNPALARPIEDTPRSMAAILGAWRDAERRHAAAAPGSVEADVARLEIERLRTEYRRAHEERTRGK